MKVSFMKQCISLFVFLFVFDVLYDFGKCDSIYKISYDKAGEAILHKSRKVRDIEIGEDSGIDVKTYIEDNRLDIIIIFITSYDSYVMDSFGINVLGFIEKSAVKEKLISYLSRAIEIKTGDELIIEGLNIRTVKYVQSDGAYVRLVADDTREALHRVSMNEMEKLLLEHDFLRAHRCYIVNLRYIKKIITVGHGKKYIMIDDEKIKISEKYANRFLEQYKEYCLRELKVI